MTKRARFMASGFRKEWDQFDQLTNEIGPHLYEIAYFMDGSR
jgi:hypothetical protein